MTRDEKIFDMDDRLHTVERELQDTNRRLDETRDAFNNLVRQLSTPQEQPSEQ